VENRAILPQLVLPSKGHRFAEKNANNLAMGAGKSDCTLARCTASVPLKLCFLLLVG